MSDRRPDRTGSRDGRHIDIDGVPALRFERHLPKPVAAVWRALTEPARLRQWMHAEAIVEPRVGGVFRLDFAGSAHAMIGEITCWQPSRLLEFTWPEVQANGRSLVRFELRQAGTGTVLILTHLLQAGGNEPDFAAGWHCHLDALDRALDGETLAFDRPRFVELRAIYTACL